MEEKSAKTGGPLGLHRETLRLVDSHLGWSRAFETEKHRILKLTGGLRLSIEHIGSTAVPGLIAKPIIDIAIAIGPSIPVDAVVSALCNGGYKYEEDMGSNGGRFLVVESERGVRTHHVHLIGESDPQWANYLRFRDVLRSEAAVRDDYLKLKMGLASKYAEDRAGYTHAKSEFIRKTLARSEMRR